MQYEQLSLIRLLKCNDHRECTFWLHQGGLEAMSTGHQHHSDQDDMTRGIIKTLMIKLYEAC